MGMTYNKEFIPKDRMVVTRGPRDRQTQQKLEQLGVPTQVDNTLVRELKAQIESLQDKLSNSGSGGYSTEQVNDLIGKAVITETTEIKQKAANVQAELTKKLSILEEDILELKSKHSEEVAVYKDRIASIDSDLNHFKTKVKLLEKDLDFANEKLSEKELTISQLKSAPPQIDNKLTSLLSEATKKIEEMADKIKIYEHSVTGEVSVDSDRPQMETVFVDPIEKESSIEKHLDVEDVSVHKKEQMNDKVSKLKNLLGSLPSKR